MEVSKKIGLPLNHRIGIFLTIQLFFPSLDFLRGVSTPESERKCVAARKPPSYEVHLILLQILG